MMVRRTLQDMIDATPDGDTLVLPTGEYEGPVVLSRRISLEGAKSTVWSRRGPVMHVRAPGIHLRRLRIEVTRFDQDMAGKPEHVALLVDAGAHPVLDNVVVRGYVMGIPGENGAWLFPPSIDLGAFAPRAVNTFTVKLFVPVPCQVSTSITGVTITPATLSPGENTLLITVDGLYPETMLVGRCYIQSARVMRPIDLNGRAEGRVGLPPADRRLLWEPSQVPTRPVGGEGATDACKITEQWLEDEINRLIRAGSASPHGGLVRR